MRRKIITALAVSLALATPALAVDWNFYHHQSAPLFATSRGAKMLSEEIEKSTNGELKARLHLSGTLQIAPNNITAAVAGNVVQLADDLFNSGNIAVAGIPRLPGLVRSLEEYTKAAEALRPYVVNAFAEKGVVVLAEYTYPLQVIWGRKKIASLDDIKGLKLRVAQPEQGEMVRRFGGTSVTISAPEVPSALDRGVVDGIYTAGVGAVLWKDLLKFGFLVPVNWNNSYIIANADAYNKLSPDLQKKLREAAEKIAKWTQDTMQQEESESVDVVKKAGMEITVAKPEEAAKVADTMKSYWDEWAKSRGPMVAEALGKVRAALSR